jgi:hypothetical protein
MGSLVVMYKKFPSHWTEFGKRGPLLRHQSRSYSNSFVSSFHLFLFIGLYVPLVLISSTVPMCPQNFPGNLKILSHFPVVALSPLHNAHEIPKNHLASSSSFLYFVGDASRSEFREFAKLIKDSKKDTREALEALFPSSR